MKVGALSVIASLLFACDAKDQLFGIEGGRKLSNEISKATKSCSTYKTDNQADAENKVEQTGVDYKFNLYWMGDSKLSVTENRLLNDNYVLDLEPPTLHLLNADGAEAEKIICSESKANAEKCITRLENLKTFMKDMRASLVARNAAFSEGKEFTFKCTEEYADKTISQLKLIQ
jgi:hypothetical protein